MVEITVTYLIGGISGLVISFIFLFLADLYNGGTSTGRFFLSMIFLLNIVFFALITTLLFIDPMILNDEIFALLVTLLPTILITAYIFGTAKFKAVTASPTIIKNQVKNLSEGNLSYTPELNIGDLTEFESVILELERVRKNLADYFSDEKTLLQSTTKTSNSLLQNSQTILRHYEQMELYEINKTNNSTFQIEDSINKFEQQLKNTMASAKTVNDVSNKIKLIAINAAIEAEQNIEASESFSFITKSIQELSLQSLESSQRHLTDLLEFEVKFNINMREVEDSLTTSQETTEVMRIDYNKLVLFLQSSRAAIVETIELLEQITKSLKQLNKHTLAFQFDSNGKP